MAAFCGHADAGAGGNARLRVRRDRDHGYVVERTDVEHAPQRRGTVAAPFVLAGNEGEAHLTKMAGLHKGEEVACGRGRRQFRFHQQTLSVFSQFQAAGRHAGDGQSFVVDQQLYVGRRVGQRLAERARRDLLDEATQILRAAIENCGVSDELCAAGGRAGRGEVPGHAGNEILGLQFILHSSGRGIRGRRPTGIADR